MGSNNSKNRKAVRRAEAEKRQEEYDSLTWEERANRWANRVKAGMGAGEKEKAKLSQMPADFEEFNI